MPDTPCGLGDDAGSGTSSISVVLGSPAAGKDVIMSWAALTSGGKDSILSVQKAIDSGKEVRYLVTARPENRDSYMFHSANLDAVAVIAKVAGMQYVEIPTHGRKEEELADLEAGLAALDVEGVTAGAVASRYQADRVKTITDRLGIMLFTPLWHMDTEHAAQGGGSPTGGDNHRYRS